jgi:hypothetical protein
MSEARAEEPLAPFEIVHIAAQPVRIGPLCRQRCAWCGAVLADHDLTLIGVPEGEWREPSDEHPWGPLSAWPVGRLIAHDGAARWVVEEENPEGPLPPGACAKLPPEATL